MSLGEKHLQILSSTTIFTTFSVRITISCRMNFDDYPLDAHTCQFQVGSCKSLPKKRGETLKRVCIADYDTKDMVTCTAAFIYDLKRQRSLQHFLTIEDLPEQFHTVVIPSGEVSPVSFVGSRKPLLEGICKSQNKSFLGNSISWDIYSLAKMYRWSSVVTAQMLTFS